MRLILTDKPVNQNYVRRSPLYVNHPRAHEYTTSRRWRSHVRRHDNDGEKAKFDGTGKTYYRGYGKTKRRKSGFWFHESPPKIQQRAKEDSPQICENARFLPSGRWKRTVFTDETRFCLDGSDGSACFWGDRRLSRQ